MGSRKRRNKPPGFEFLGILIFLQFFISGSISLYRRVRRERSSERNDFDDESDDDDSDEKDEDFSDNCSMCFCRIKDTSVTDCGHRFCWKCICKACTDKGECPLCRTPQKLSNIIKLHHYEKSSIEQ